MGTPINPLSKSAVELLQSDLPEDKHLGDVLAGRMEQMVAYINPLLKYLLHGGLVRVVAIWEEQKKNLEVDRNGHWRIYKQGESTTDSIGFPLPDERSDTPWLHFPAGLVSEGLAKLSKEVEEAKTRYLAAISEAHAKLEAINTILQS